MCHPHRRMLCRRWAMPGEAAAAVAELGAEMDGADAAALIRAALKKLAPKS